MSDSKLFSFAIDTAGRLQASNFKTRNLKKVLDSALGDDWKKSPKKLLKAMQKSPDVYTAVYTARQQMIPQYVARYEELHNKVKELSALGLKAMELDHDGLPSHDDMQDVESNDIFETYAETRQEALRCHRALSLMQKSTLSEWLERMDKTEFRVLAGEIKNIVDRDVCKSDSVFCFLKDSPEGLALGILMEAAPAGIKSLGFSRVIENDAACAVVSDRKAFKGWCEDHGYEVVDQRSTPSMTSTVSNKCSRNAAKLQTDQKTTKKVPSDRKQPSRPQLDRTPQIAVRILKTEARLATASPKTSIGPKTASAPAKSAENANDDLANRLVRSLQITPSAVEHRSPGRPRKNASVSIAESKQLAGQDHGDANRSHPEISSRPASRNKSGSPKA